MKTKIEQIPPEITNAVADEVEKLIFPNPPKTFLGKIGRVALKILKIFIPK